jgi:MFS family permease
MADIIQEEPNEFGEENQSRGRKSKKIKKKLSSGKSSGCGNLSSFCSHVQTNCTDESASYKFFNFFFYGAVQTFNSYVSVYLKTLGLTASHVGLINGTHPLLQIIGAPLAGILGDRFKIKRILLLVGLVIMTVRTMLFLPFQPEKQVCNVVYVNKTHHAVVSSKLIEFHITKRSTGEQFPESTNEHPNPRQHENNVGIVQTLLEDFNLITNTSNVESEIARNVKPNTDVDPFLSPPSVIIEKTKNYKLIFVKTENQDEIERIFIILLVLTLLGEIFEALVSTIADTCCLDYLGEDRERFGMFRFWGALGAGITSPISGAIFDHYGQTVCGRTVSGYHYVFYIYFAYLCAAFIAATHFRYRYDSSTSSSKNKDIKDALFNLNYGIFLLVTLFMGLCYGFLTSFSFWFLDDLGANAVLLGVASSLRSVAENCVYFISPYVLVRLGHAKVAAGCLVAFAVTCLSYSFLHDPWFAVPLEILSTGAYAFSWTTCVSYLNRAAPPGSSTIVQGTLRFITNH